METLTAVLERIDSLVWGIPLMVLILAGGILLTARMKVLQLRKLPLALKWMFKNEEEGDGEISSFAALCTALQSQTLYRLINRKYTVMTTIALKGGIIYGISKSTYFIL